MTRSGWRHINERLIDRIVNGDAQIVADDDPRDYTPDGYEQWQIDQRGDEAADRYEQAIERNYP